jgi:hypothetical protein
VSGVAAAWVDFDGITNVIQDSNNIASLTDQGTGQYQLAFSNNMSTQYFSISTNTGNRDSSNAGIQRSSQGGTSSSSNFHYENMSDSSNTNEDAAAGQGTIHGDLA